MNGKYQEDKCVNILIRKLLSVSLDLWTSINLYLLIQFIDCLLIKQKFAQIAEICKGLMMIEETNVFVDVVLCMVALFHGAHGHADLEQIDINIAQFLFYFLIELLVNGFIHLQDILRSITLLKLIHEHLFYQIYPYLIVVLLLFCRHFYLHLSFSDLGVPVFQYIDSSHIFEELHAGQHFIQNEASAPDVASFIIVHVDVHLRGFVKRSTSSKSVDDFIVFGQAKISDFDVIELIKKQVCRFEISMHYFLLMKKGEALKELFEPFHHKILRNSTLLYYSIFQSADAKLHEEVDSPVGFSRTKVIHDVRVWIKLEFFQDHHFSMYQFPIALVYFREYFFDGNDLTGLNIASLEDSCIFTFTDVL